MGAQQRQDLVRRWWRPAALVAVLALAWLLAAPRGPAPTSVALSGPNLTGAANDAATRPTTHSSTSAGAPSVATARIRRVVVHVAGAVRHPGVYRVRAPGRLIDAVHRAGGLTPDADLTQINLAARLTDGRAIIVPSTAPTSLAGTPTEPGAAGSPAAQANKVSVNTATAAQLDTLDGVGPAMAAAIVALRTKLGGFTRIEQLDDVPGVGEKRLASLQQQLEL